MNFLFESIVKKCKFLQLMSKTSLDKFKFTISIKLQMTKKKYLILVF